MKDMIPAGTGNSRFLKSAISADATWEEVRALLRNGVFPIDFAGLNLEGIVQQGSPINKAFLLDDTTAAALELSDDDATVNKALYVLSKKGASAEIRVVADPGTTVTMSRNGKILTATATSKGYAILHSYDLGEWGVTFTFNGSLKNRTYLLDTIGIVYVFPSEIGRTLEETAWDTIAAISSVGLASVYWQIGDKKNITVNDVVFAVQIIGFEHDVLSSPTTDRTKAGITFQLVDCLADFYKISTSSTNEDGWKNSLMRLTTLPTIFNQLSSDLQPYIKYVNKQSVVGGGSASTESTSDNLFLPSAVEVVGNSASTQGHSYSLDEGQEYEFYAAGNETRKMRINTSAYNTWWLRSADPTDQYWYKGITTGNSGQITSLTGTTTKIALSFAFCV